MKYLLGSSKHNKVKKNIKKLIPFVIIIGILISLAVFLVTLSGTSSYVNYIFSGTNLKSNADRVNVLLLGIAGGRHDGANLTDTVMVASYNLKTNQVYLISIPRDLWLPSLKSKVNAVYQIGQSQNNGLGLSKTVIGNILGLPIHYALRVDFGGFVKMIDAVEGIDVQVDKSFDDYNYPIDGKEEDLCGFVEKEMDFSEDEAKKLNIERGKRKVLIDPSGKIATDSAEEDKGIKYFSCRYEHIHFDKGLTHMNGETALQFVRSRHGTNSEGSDFARSQRQQKVLDSLRGKVLSLETLTDSNKISELIKTLGQSIDTDISVKDGIEFYKLSRKLSKTYNFVLNDSPKANLPNQRTALLVRPKASNYGGAYVLVSEDDDFSIIQGYVKKLLTGEVRLDEATSAARSR